MLDVIPLSQQEQSIVYRSFQQDPMSGALSIYWEKPDGSWGEDPATRAQCAGLERTAVWDPEHLEDRLRDHRAGRPNRWGRVPGAERLIRLDGAGGGHHRTRPQMPL